MNAAASLCLTVEGVSTEKAQFHRTGRRYDKVMPTGLLVVWDIGRALTFTLQEEFQGVRSQRGYNQVSGHGKIAFGAISSPRPHPHPTPVVIPPFAFTPPSGGH